MNKIESIELTQLNNNTESAVIFYTSVPYPETGKEFNHCEIVRINNLFRVVLNESSFTLVYNEGGRVKFAVPENFDVQPIADLVEERHGAGLKVIEHFANVRARKNAKNKSGE